VIFALMSVALAAGLFVRRQQVRRDIESAEHGPDLEGRDAWAAKRAAHLAKHRKQKRSGR
jgi:hypothetical protein